ncbi:MAG: tetratricopeptide repeat protein [Desulfatitalea sp.]|nr:tetratricopeptide repeat protein [Desulfatitalea sp.]
MASAWASPLVIDPRQQLHYAEQLYTEGQFLRAAEEYERFAFFFPESSERRMALLKAGQAFMQAGDHSTALKRFNDLSQLDPLDPVAVDAHFMAAECQLRMGNPNLSLLEMQRLITRTDDSALRDSAYLRIAWIHIDQMDWHGARYGLQRISPEGRGRLKVEALEAELARSDEIPLKSPALAGTLSILPGAGQLYCGRYEDALAALVVNGGLFLAAYESFDHDLNALGALLSIAGLGFYTANIYGAVTDAHKYNQARRQDFVDQLRQQMSISIGIGPSMHSRKISEGLLVSIRFNF